MDSNKDVNIVTQCSLNPPFFISTLHYKELLLSKRSSTSTLQLSPDKSVSQKPFIKSVPVHHPRSYSKPISPEKPNFIQKTFSSTESSKFAQVQSKLPKSSASFMLKTSGKSSPDKLSPSIRENFQEKSGKKAVVAKLKVIFARVRTDFRDLKKFKTDFDCVKLTIENLINILNRKSLPAGIDKAGIIKNERLVIQQKVKIKQLEDTVKSFLLEKGSMQSRLIDDNYKILLLTEQNKLHESSLKQAENEFDEKLNKISEELATKVRAIDKDKKKLELELEKYKIDLECLSQKLKTEQEKSKNMKEELDFCSNENIKLMQNSINLIEEMLELKKSNQELNKKLENRETEKAKIESEETKKRIEDFVEKLEKKEQELMVLRKKWERNKDKKKILLEKWENLELDLNQLLQEKSLWEKKEKAWMENEILWKKKNEVLAKGIEEYRKKENELSTQKVLGTKSEWESKELELVNMLKELRGELEEVKEKQKRWKSKKNEWKKKESQWEQCRDLWDQSEQEWERQKGVWESKKSKIKSVKSSIEQVQNLWKQEKEGWTQEKQEFQRKIQALNEKMKKLTLESERKKGSFTNNEQLKQVEVLKNELEQARKLISHWENKKHKWKQAKVEFQSQEKQWKVEKFEYMCKESELLNMIHQFEADQKSQQEQLQVLVTFSQEFPQKIHELSQIVENKIQNFSKSLFNIFSLMQKLKKPLKIAESVLENSLSKHSSPLNLPQDLQESSVLPTNLFLNQDFLHSNIEKLHSCLPKLRKLIKIFSKLLKNRSKPPKANQTPAKILYFSQVPTEYLSNILESLKSIEKPVLNLIESSKFAENSPDSAIKIEISYQISESELIQNIKKSEESYTKDLELLIFSLKEQHENDLIKIYSEMDERESLYTEEILRLNQEIVTLSKKLSESENNIKSLHSKLLSTNEDLQNKADQIYHLNSKLSNFLQCPKTVQKVSQTDQYTETDPIDFYQADQYQILQTLYEESSVHLSNLQISYTQLMESHKSLQREFEVLRAEYKDLMEDNENLNEELKSFQFSNKL